MEKIVVCGSCRHEAVLQRYKGCGAQIDFDVPCASLQIKYDYSAAFFMPDCGDEVLRAWVGNEHLRLCADENALFAEMDFFFGIPQPLEIERKFLIARPAESVLSRLDFCDYADISQAYINDENGRYRVRRRGRNGAFVYIKTQKIRLSEQRRIEKENRISKSEYEAAIQGQKLLSKRRYLILSGGKYFELDVFPFWQDVALLEIELKDEKEPFELPAFVNAIKEVSADKSYRNSVIAQKYGVAAE